MDRAQMDIARRQWRQAAAAVGGLLVLAAGAWTSYAYGHGGEIEVAGGGQQGPVRVSDIQQKAIGLQWVVADLRAMSELLTVNGEVQLLPGRQAEVSTRISGQVTALYAGLGDTVKVGQRVARVQSRLVGDPPPSVDVTASMTGVVEQRNVALGQSVEPSTVMFRISDRSQVNVAARVYEEDLAKVQVGQEATVHFLSYPGQVFAGRVTLVGPTLDPASRTVEIWVQLANPNGLFKPNLFATVGLLLRKSAAALAIPTAAIMAANGENFVFVRQGENFERIEITAGISDDTFTEVTDGIVPGDEVVTQGNRQLYTLWLTGGKMKTEE